MKAAAENSSCSYPLIRARMCVLGGGKGLVSSFSSWIKVCKSETTILSIT